MIKWKSILAYFTLWLFFVVIFFGLAVVINFYFWNFVFQAFNVSFQLTWLQASAIVGILMFIRALFKKGDK